MGKARKQNTLKAIWDYFHSVKARLSFSLLVILIIPSTLIGVFSYQTAANQVEKQMIDKAETSMTLLNGVINQFIMAKQQEIDMLAHTLNGGMIKVKPGSNVGISSEATKTLDTFKNSHAEVSLAYIGTEDGVYINSPSNLLNPADFDPRVRSWYIAAMENKGTPIVTSIYESKATNSLVITIAEATADNKGVVALNVELDQIKEIAKSITIGNQGYAYVIDAERNFIYHPEKEIGSQAPDTPQFNRLFEEDNGTFEYKNDETKSYREVVFLTNELTGWKLVGVFDKSEFGETASPILRTMLIVLIISIVAGCLISYTVLRSIIRPMNRILAATEKISSGDLTEEIVNHRKDEFGILNNSFNKMVRSIRSILSNVNETSTQVAASSEQLSASSEQTTRATEQISEHAQSMAEGAESQVQQVNHSLATGTKLVERSQHIASSVNELREKATTATEHSEIGGQTVKSAVYQMNSIYKNVGSLSSDIEQLGVRSTEISNIVNVIKDISGQTGLLALNAAIEAARAGNKDAVLQSLQMKFVSLPSSQKKEQNKLNS